MNMWTYRTLRFVTFAAVLEATMMLTPAKAEFGNRFWLSHVNQSASDPEMAIAANGNAVFVWKQNPGSADHYRVQARQVSAGGALGPILDISKNGKDVLGFPKVAIDGSGNAVFVWTYSDGSETWIQGRTLSAAGVLGPILKLSDISSDFDLPQLAVDSAGDTVFIWSRGVDNVRRAEARALSPAGVLGPVMAVSIDADGNAFRPQIGISAAGTAVLAWQVFGRRIKTRTLSTAGVLGPVQKISGLKTVGFELAVNNGGDAMFVWNRETSKGERIKARRLSAKGIRGPTLDISSVAALAYDASAAIDESGDAVFTWRRKDAGYRYQGRALSVSGVLGPILDLTEDSPHRICQPWVTIDAEGDALFAWAQAVDDQYYQVQTRPLSADGTLGPVINLSKPGNDSFCVRIGISPDGARAAAVWQTRPSLQETDFRIQGIMSR
jgi:hypothetical protein